MPGVAPPPCCQRILEPMEIFFAPPEFDVTGGGFEVRVNAPIHSWLPNKKRSPSPKAELGEESWGKRAGERELG